MISINIKVVDGKAMFAKQTITYIKKGRDIEKLVYNNLEMQALLETLEDENIEYTIKDLTWEQSLINRCKNKKFNSRTELIEYIQHNIEPEKEIIPSLRKKNEELKNIILQQQDIIDYFIKPQDYKVN